MEKATRKIDEYSASWYIVYTATNAEEMVNKQLEQSCFETYLPLHPVTRVWNSQKRKVMIPLIPRTIFVCLSKNDIEQMTSLDKGAFLLQEKDQYVSISFEQMKALRDAVEQTNGSMKFVSEEFNTEVVAGEQLPELTKEPVSQRYFAKFILPIKGLGIISADVDNCIHQKS